MFYTCWSNLAQPTVYNPSYKGLSLKLRFSVVKQSLSMTVCKSNVDRNASKAVLFKVNMKEFRYYVVQMSHKKVVVP